MKTILIPLLSISILLLLLPACGQKGPLYLPDPQPKQTRHAHRVTL